VTFIKAVYRYLYSNCLSSQEFLQEQALSINWQLGLVRNLTLCLKFCALSSWVTSTFQGIFTCLYSACIVFTSDCGTVVQSCVVRSGLMLLLQDLARLEWVSHFQSSVFSVDLSDCIFSCVESPLEEPIDISMNYVKICTLRMARLWINKDNDVTDPQLIPFLISNTCSRILLGTKYKNTSE